MMAAHSRMVRSCLVVLALLAALTTAARAQDVPFTGIVNEDNTAVRAGAGRAYYVVGELDRGQLVQVEEILFGWNKIKSPEGFYSYVPRAFVDATGDGSVGVVNADRTEVKAASLSGPGDTESFKTQVLLNKGDRVRIIEQEGDHYKIAPPSDAYVWLPPGSVRRASSMEAAREPAQPAQPAAPAEPAAAPAAQAEPEASAQQPSDSAAEAQPASTEPVEADLAEAADEAESAAPAEEGSAEVEVAEGEASAEAAAETTETEAPTQPAADAAAAAGVQTPAVSPALRQVETQMLPLFERPLEEQPLDQMEQAYQQVASGGQLPGIDRRIVEIRLAAIRHNQELAGALKQISDARGASDAAAQQAEEVDDRPVRYDAVGRLLASSVYNGESLPRLYRLADPGSGRTLAYVEPGGPVRAHLLGQVVGIVGKSTYDTSMKLQVIEVKRIDHLEAARARQQAQAPAQPEPQDEPQQQADAEQSAEPERAQDQQK